MRRKRKLRNDEISNRIEAERDCARKRKNEMRTNLGKPNVWQKNQKEKIIVKNIKKISLLHFVKTTSA